MKKRINSYFLSAKVLLDYKIQTLIIFFVSVVSAVASGLSIGLLIPILEADSRPLFSDTPFKYLDEFIKIFSGNSFNDRVLLVSILIIVLSSLELVMNLLSGILSAKTENQIKKDYTFNVLDKLQKIEFTFFQNQTSGKLFTFLTTDPNITSKIGKKILITFQPAVLLIVYLSVMYTVSPIMTVLSLFFFVFISIISTSQIGNKIALSQKEISTKLFYINSEVQETLDNFKNILSHGLLEQQLKRLRNLFNEFFIINYKFQRDTTFVIPINNFVNSFGIAILLIAGTIIFREQDSSWTALLIPFLILLFKLLPAISQLNNLRVYLEANYIYIDRLNNFLQIDNFLIVQGDKPFNKLENQIEFKNVEFKYHNSKFLIKNFNLKIPANKTTAVIGVSGSGKTTMIDLLLKIYYPSEGQILFDDTDINLFKNSTLRNKISYVSQDTLFFNRSIDENLNLLNDTSKDFSDLFDKMNLSNFNKNKNQIIGSGGVNLSSGQKQKFNFIRAYLKEAEILILDEPTSNLDFESQNILKNYLKEIEGTKTVIVVTHTASILSICENVVVIEDGEIVQSGQISEIKNKSSYFREMLNGK